MHRSCPQCYKCLPLPLSGLLYHYAANRSVHVANHASGVEISASIAAIARIYFTYRLFQIPKRAAENLNICMDVEFGVNIICTAAITLKPLLCKTGILTASTVSRSGPQSVLIFPGRSARCGSGEGGLRIHDEGEIAIWSEAQAGGACCA